VRLFAYTTALQQMIDHPIVGWGTFTFAPLVAQGGDFQQFEQLGAISGSATTCFSPLTTQAS